MQDDLFRPTIQERPLPGRPPWRPESIFYPAFFGGPLAAATLGVLNGRRLGLRAGPLLAIAAAGLAAFVTRIVVTSLIDGNSGARLTGTLTGIAVWLVVLGFQRRPFRAIAYGGTEPSSLFRAGFAAAIGLGFLEAFILLVLVR